MAAATTKQAVSPATPAVENRAATTTASGAAASTPPAAITTPAKKASVENMTTQTTPATPATPDVPTKVAPAAGLLVLDREDPWTKAELKSVRVQLVDDVERLAGELAEVEGDLAGMIENSGEGAGHDQADVGSASFERDQEMVIVHNARDMLEQSQHALERIADGSYGACEVCGQAIGKNRLMAFPRATLCLKCKQREERR